MKQKLNNKYYLGVGVLALIVTTLAVSGFVNAGDVEDNYDKISQKRGQIEKRDNNFMQNNNEAVLTAIQNNDFEAWKTAVGENSPLLEKITADNWSRFVEMHTNLDSAKKIAEELGLSNGFMGAKKEFRQKGFANNEAVKAALENNDYQAWVAAIGDNFPVKDKITEETFAKLVEAHNLMQNNDMDGARAIFDEIGLKGFRANR